MDKRVCLARCESYDSRTVREAVRRVFAAFGGAAALCGGKRVLLKPNLLLAFTPEAAATTHPAVVAAVAEELLSAGCEVTLAESAGGAYTAGHLRKLYAATGMEKAAQETGFTLNYETGSRIVKYPEGVVCKTFSIIDPIADADIIIDIAKLKTHGLAYYTGAVKNMFGAVPGLTKPAMHSLFPDRDRFCSMIVDLCLCTKPRFSIIDGIVGMQGHGPSGGTPKAANVLIGAENPFAADLAGCTIMGLDPALAPTIAESIRRGLIPGDCAQLELSCDPIASFLTHFVPADRSKKTVHPLLPKPLRVVADGWTRVYPAIRRKICVGCGACMRTCPQHTIRIVDRKAVIEYDNCIRCYCCHELCPERAIRFERRLTHGGKRLNKTAR